VSFERARSFDALGIEHGFGGAGTLAAAAFAFHRAQQVHGTALARAPFAAAPEADAVWTAAPGVAVAVVTADCVPILLSEPRGRFVCAVHAGWRGSAARIASQTVRALARATGIAPGEMIAAIGPHIGPCCYEVDAPVVTPLRAAFPESWERWVRPVVSEHPDRPDHWWLDLWAANADQLVAAGVSPGAILSPGLCTGCRRDLFFSYRKEGLAGRLATFAVLG